MVAPLFGRKGFPQHKFPTVPTTPDQPVPQHAQWGWMDRQAVVNTSVVFVGAAALFAIASVPSHFVYAAPVVAPQAESPIFGQDPRLFVSVAVPSRLIYLEQQKVEVQPSAVWGTTPRTIVPLGPTLVLQPGSAFLPESWIQERLQVPVSSAPPVSPSWTHAWTYIGQLAELQPSNIWGTPLIDSVTPVATETYSVRRSPHRRAVR